MGHGVPFGSYFLQRRLGAGGMAEVFLAKRFGPDGFEKRLVIKRLLPHLSSSEAFTSLFLKEARLAAGLEHPNLVHVSDFGEVEGSYYLAMELVDGMTVSDLLSRSGALPVAVACRIAIDLLEALQSIHSAQHAGEPLSLVHRDVSPSNVMVTRDGAVKLLDFGIATSGADAAASPIGTRLYMSPEQLRGEALDARSDLFSVGVLVYHMVCGQRPFGEQPHAMERPEGVSEALWQVLGALLALDRDQRPANAREVAGKLELLLAATGVGGSRALLADRVVELAAGKGIRQSGGLTEVFSTLAEITKQLPRARVRRWTILATFAAVALGGALFVSQRDDPEGAGVVSPLLGRPPPLQLVQPSRDEPAPRPASDGAPATRRPKAHRRSSKAKRELPAPPVSPKVAASGWLTINTQPWTEVYLQGRRLGMTPLEGISLPSGALELELRNPQLGLSRRVPITIRPGETTRLNLTL